MSMLPALSASVGNESVCICCSPNSRVFYNQAQKKSACAKIAALFCCCCPCLKRKKRKEPYREERQYVYVDRRFVEQCVFSSHGADMGRELLLSYDSDWDVNKRAGQHLHQDVYAQIRETQMREKFGDVQDGYLTVRSGRGRRRRRGSILEMDMTAAPPTALAKLILQLAGKKTSRKSPDQIVAMVRKKANRKGFVLRTDEELETVAREVSLAESPRTLTAQQRAVFEAIIEISSKL